ncbi:MAG: hypothetical protein IJI66_17055 [Erysipelotrichaceae bacterium]|nr:hypothetical protein [Erysipelotrichaceae bacterium]
MKRKMDFIAKVALTLLMVVGCLSFKSIDAEGDKLKFTIDSSVASSIEGTLVIDLYRIADIVWDGSNTKQTTYVLKTTEETKAFKDVFDGLDVGVDKEQRDADPTYNEIRSKKDLSELANTAAGIVFGSNPKIASTKQELPINTENAVDAGLYLAIVRNKGTEAKPIAEADVDKYLKDEDGNYYSFANSHDKEYDFNPYLVFVVGDNVNPVNLDEEVKTEEGETEIVHVKYSEKDRFGLMEIIKYVSLGGEPATVVFRVQGYESEEAYKAGDDPIYEKVLAIGIEDAGEYRDDSLVLDDILVNTYVVVTEEYAGASYVLYNWELPDSSIITPIEEDDDGNPIAQTWKFWNKLDDKRKKGYGIKNTFTKGEENWNYPDAEDLDGGNDNYE